MLHGKQLCVECKADVKEGEKGGLEQEGGIYI